MATVAHTGSPNDTCPTIPSPKKVAVRSVVRSMNWSGTTNSVGLMLQFERSDGGNRDDPLHAQLLHGEDIGPEVELAGQDAMATAVTSKESHPPSFQLAGDQYIGRVAERRGYLNLLRIAEAGHAVEPASADDSDFRLLQTWLRIRNKLLPAQYTHPSFAVLLTHH